MEKTKSNRRVRCFREQYLENRLHVISDSGKPIVALFGGGGSSNRVGRRRNGGVCNRVKKSLRSAKQFSEQAFSVLRLGQELGFESEPGDGEGAAKKVSGRTGESVRLRTVGEAARAPVPERSKDYVGRAR